MYRGCEIPKTREYERRWRCDAGNESDDSARFDHQQKRSEVASAPEDRVLPFSEVT